MDNNDEKYHELIDHFQQVNFNEKQETGSKTIEKSEDTCHLNNQPLPTTFLQTTHFIRTKIPKIKLLIGTTRKSGFPRPRSNQKVYLRTNKK